MSRRLRLPPPPKEYSQEYERVRNREIEMILNEKISDTDVPLYGGVPFVCINGTSTTFSVATGTTAVLIPFNNQLKDTDPHLTYDVVNYNTKSDIIFDALVLVDLYKPLTGGNTIFDVVLQVFLGGVLKYTTVKSVSTRDNAVASISNLGIAIPANTAIEVKVYHTAGSAVVFDLTQSRISISRYSPVPRL